jgi:hypothetical protein
LKKSKRARWTSLLNDQPASAASGRRAETRVIEFEGRRGVHTPHERADERAIGLRQAIDAGALERLLGESALHLIELFVEIHDQQMEAVGLSPGRARDGRYVRGRNVVSDHDWQGGTQCGQARGICVEGRCQSVGNPKRREHLLDAREELLVNAIGVRNHDGVVETRTRLAHHLVEGDVVFTACFALGAQVGGSSVRVAGVITARLH